MPEDAGGLSEAAQKRRMEARARKYIEEYKYQVAALLGLPPADSIWVHEVFRDDLYGAIAYVNESPTAHLQPVMTLNFSYLLDNPEQLEGVIVHELAHATIAAAPGGQFGQYGPHQTVPWAFNEGLADYARIQLTGTRGGQPGYSGRVSPIHAGYQDMANFLQWQEKRSPGTARGIARLLSEKRLDSTTFEDMIGVPMHETIAEYRAGPGTNLKTPTNAREGNLWYRHWQREETRKHDVRYRHNSYKEEDIPRPDASFERQKLRGLLANISLEDFFALNGLAPSDSSAIGVVPSGVIDAKDKASRGDPAGPKPQPNAYNPVHQQI